MSTTSAAPSRGRLVLGGLGVAVGLYGAVLLLTGLSPSGWLRVALWMGGAAVAHDLLVVPVVLALAWVGRRLLPRPLWGPAALGLVVSGGITAVAAVALIRRGDDAGISSLLDRDYVAGYVMALVVVWAGVVVVAAVTLARAGRRRRRPVTSS